MCGRWVWLPGSTLPLPNHRHHVMLHCHQRQMRLQGEWSLLALWQIYRSPQDRIQVRGYESHHLSWIEGWITCGWKLLVSITHNSPLPLWFTYVQPFFLSPFSLGFLYLPPSLQGRTLETEICHFSATRFPFIILFSLYFFPVQWSVRQTTSNTATLFQTWPRKYITAEFLWLHQKRKKSKYCRGLYQWDTSRIPRATAHRGQV